AHRQRVVPWYEAMLARVPRPLRFAFFLALFVIAGVGAYWLGTSLRPQPEPAGTQLTDPVQISGLELVDQRGQPFDLAENLRGDVALVFFGYTRCPDVCPFTMAQLSSVYSEVGEPEDLKVVLVT